jgi:hypothetical protein
MNLTFKRGTHDNLNNTEITQDMLYFTTDDNCIYMDNNGQRYKIFGLNNSDIVSTKEAASINTYYNNSSHLFLKTTDVAQSGNTSSKIAIGSGYYNNVIGQGIEDILYTDYPSLTSSISYLNNNARGNLDTLWTNNTPSSTWSVDLDGNTTTSNESKVVAVSSSYLGYIVFVQACLSDQSIKTYPITLFNLPSSVLADHGTNACTREFNTTFNLADGYSQGAAVNTCDISANLTFSLNPATGRLTITKKGSASWGFDPYQVLFHNYLVPVKVFGWKV